MLREFFERRGQLQNPDAWFLGLGRSSSASGIDVTEEKALSWTAFAAGIRIIAETMASLPLNCYERQEDGGRALRTTHWLYPLLHDQPNPEMTSFEWREISQAHVLLFGDAYSLIDWNKVGQAQALWPLNPDRVRPERRNGALWYRLSLPTTVGAGTDGSTLIPADDMLHLRGFSTGGLVGRSNVLAHREAIGLGLATEEFVGRFFGQGAHAGGFLEYKGTLSKEAQERLKSAIDKQHSGLSNAHKMMILEEGMKFVQTTIDPEKAKLLELRKFQVREASRILRIPPHLLGDLDQATFSNIEQQAIEFVMHTVRPWAVRWEQRLRASLIGQPSKKKLFVEYALDALLRGDLQSRYTAYGQGRQWGYLSVNDIRRLENLNPIGPEGDRYLEPVNMTAVGEPPSTDPEAVRTLQAIRALLNPPSGAD